MTMPGYPRKSGLGNTGVMLLPLTPITLIRETPYVLPSNPLSIGRKTYEGNVLGTKRLCVF